MARYTRGKYQGRKGARRRILSGDGTDMLYGAEARNYAQTNGLPMKITGDPLGCGCSEADFVSCTGAIDGQVEADYNCDSGWHNYVVFQVREQKQKATRKTEIDKFGKEMKDKSFVAEELQEL